jgi:hypothetical protein
MNRTKKRKSTGKWMKRRMVGRRKSNEKRTPRTATTSAKINRLLFHTTFSWVWMYEPVRLITVAEKTSCGCRIRNSLLILERTSSPRRYGRGSRETPLQSSWQFVAYFVCVFLGWSQVWLWSPLMTVLGLGGLISGHGAVNAKGFHII